MIESSNSLTLRHCSLNLRVVVEETFSHDQVMLWCAIKANVSNLCGCVFRI